jgi:hypothetical protein
MQCSPGRAASAAAFGYEPIVTGYVQAANARLAAPMVALAEGPQAPAQFAFDHGALGMTPGLFAFVVSGAAPWVAQGMEAAGEALLAQYLERYLAQLDTLLQPDAAGTPARARLMRYWSYWNMSQCGIAPADASASGCADEAAGAKCLIVKLSAEVADMSEPMRLALRRGTDDIVQRIAQCLHDCDGEVFRNASDGENILYRRSSNLGNRAEVFEQS